MPGAIRAFFYVRFQEVSIMYLKRGVEGECCTDGILKTYFIFADDVLW